MKLKMADLIIEPRAGGQLCKTCPFLQENKLTCLKGKENFGLWKRIHDKVYKSSIIFCASFTIKNHETK